MIGIEGVGKEKTMMEGRREEVKGSVRKTDPYQIEVAKHFVLRRKR